MKQLLVIILTFSFLYNGVCQDGNKEIKTNKFLKELSENACLCIDSIETYNKSSVEVSADINRCIKNQTVAFQLGMTLMNIDILSEKAEDNDGQKVINVTLNDDENSDEYKESYYKIERYLMDNCESLQQKAATIDKHGEKSISDNDKAIELYTKGLAESEKEKHKKALKYYKMAVEIDSNFAFAWDNIGLCYRILGDYDEALKAYNKSLEIDPMGLMPLQNIAVVYLYTGQYHDAIKSYEKLIEVDENNPEIYYGLGHVYYEYLKEYEKGLDNLCKAYNIYIEQNSPYRTDAENLISNIYTEMKKEGKEDRFFEILKDHNITPDTK